KKGDKGDAVIVLQLLLMLRGVVTFYTIDGVFGDKTEQAVKDFQQARGIYPDGKVGAKTWPALTAK
ncbi:MAG: peptidoglycan-binding protein, partial [Eggerthellaceae bacterium]|nr:peptidoglycan-binding protein [Eggerthellaceae bacterium]